MNERVMQFRIGMFVILAGLVLTWMLIWFGETPALLRENVYVKAKYSEAPGVSVGIPVRKSGIRIGEVSAVAFDTDPDNPDGVVITIAIESKYRVKEGAVPRISRALIGDISIDFLPGKGPGYLAVGSSPANAPVVRGVVAADPASALASATVTFERAGETLESISGAAKGISETIKKVQDIDSFIATWKSAGQRVGNAAEDLSSLVRENKQNIGPAIANLREVSTKLNDLLDPDSQAKLKAAFDHLNSLGKKLNEDLATLDPLIKDLGGDAKRTPTTSLGSSLHRLNRITYDISILTAALHDGKGKLSPDGTLQALVTNRELFDNLSRASAKMSTLMEELRPVINDLKVFARNIKNDPSSLMRGALQNR